MTITFQQAAIYFWQEHAAQRWDAQGRKGKPCECPWCEAMRSSLGMAKAVPA